MQGRIALKKRDGFVDRVVLELADTRHNRWLIRHLGDALRASFPSRGMPLAWRCNHPRTGDDLLVLV